jgi:peptidoglycan/LPS O-acetylase OafA/YrhL
MDVITDKGQSNKPDRLPSLDVLRGIAAFIVLLGHLFLMYPEALRLEIPTWLRISVLRILVNGHASVILFFVLSGYVLSIPFLNGKAPPYISYLIKRVFRIYIPFAISIFIAALLYSITIPIESENSGEWIYREWAKMPLTPEIFFKHLLMTGASEEMWLNGVMWSLVVEMRISIIFPILIYLCNFPRLAVVIGIIIYLATAAIIVINDMPMQTASSLSGTFIITLRFIPFFMAGIFMVKYHEKIKERLNQLNKLQLSMIIFFISSILCMPTEIYNHKNIAFLSAIVSPETFNNILKFSADFLIGLASSLLIILVRHYGENMSFFNSAAMTWLGRISYSLYLIHLPLVFIIFHELLGQLPFYWICLITVAASLIASSIFYTVIEKPAMQAGRYLAKRIR